METPISGRDREVARGCRALVLTNIPSPYQVDLFAALAARPEVDPRVIFCAPSEHDRQFSLPGQLPFEARTLRGRRLPGTPKDWHWIPGFGRLLGEGLPYDVAVLSGGYFMPAVRTARRFCLARGIPWYYWGENPRKKPSARWWGQVKEAYLRWFLRPAIGVFGMGSPACDVYRKIVGDARPVENVPYAPNLDPLLEPDGQTRAEADTLRAGWDAVEATVILFSGSLSRRKAPEVLLAAFDRARKRNERLRLMLAGTGPLEEVLRAEVHQRGLDQWVRFLGFVEGRQLWAAYLASDLFVLPTRTHEGWGVVVQEALAAGLPVLVSERVGCYADLIEGRDIGDAFPPDDVCALAEKLVGWSCLGDQLSGVARRAREAVRGWDARSTSARMAEVLARSASRVETGSAGGGPCSGRRGTWNSPQTMV